MAINEDVLIFDHDLEGTILPNGTIKQLWEKDALTNSLKMWITSRRGDVVREPERGGYLYSWLTKPLREEEIDNIEMAIRNGIEQDFQPFLRIIALQVTPNYEGRYWEIYLETYSPYLALRSTVNEKIKATIG